MHEAITCKYKNDLAGSRRPDVVAILTGGLAGDFLENAGEVEGIGEAELGANGFELVLGACQRELGGADALAEFVLMRRDAEKLFEAAGEMGRTLFDQRGQFVDGEGVHHAAFERLQDWCEKGGAFMPAIPARQVGLFEEGCQELQQ